MGLMITPQYVVGEVENIRRMKSDDEIAHSAEDGLFIEVLEAIANGECSDPQGCAREAIITRDIEFARWCA